MKRRKALLSEEVISDKRERQSPHELLKHVRRLCTGKTSSLRPGFCTSVLFIYHVTQNITREFAEWLRTADHTLNITLYMLERKL